MPHPSEAAPRADARATVVPGTPKRTRAAPAVAVALAASLLALTAVPSVASGQSIRGTVLEAETNRPLATAFVRLQTPEGARLDGALTDADGAFTLAAPGPGVYRVVAQMLGYHTSVSEATQVTASGVSDLTIHLRLQAVQLEGLEASAERRCGETDGTGVAELWDEARKALAVAAWGEASGAMGFTLTSYERSLHPRSLEVLEDSRGRGRAAFRQRTYESLPAADLARDGYIVDAGDGEYVFYAPDAEVILSDEFVAGHCFGLKESEEDTTVVGLEFAPVRERDYGDIEGVLWVEKGTGALRWLEYEYTDLPWHRIRSDEVGGRVEFTRLDNGLWVVRRWRIRMPSVAEVRVAPSARRPIASFENRLVAIREVGGEVSRITDAEGNVLAESQAGTVMGVVFDSLAMRPLAGATVEIAGTELAATSVESGSFRLEGVPEGTYRVRVSHPDLAFIGEGIPEQLVEVRPGEASTVRAAIPSWGTLSASICGDPDQVLLYGVVTTEEGEPVPGARVGAIPASTEAVGVDLVADREGAYRGCMPAQGAEAVTLLAWPAAAPPWDTGSPLAQLAEPDTAGVTVLRDMPRPGAYRADLTASPVELEDGPLTLRVESRVAEADSTAEVERVGGLGVHGRVVDGVTNLPVVQAQVILTDEEGETVASTVADEAGRFHFPDAPGGTLGLGVRRLGYDPATVQVEYSGEEPLNLELAVSVIPVALEGLTAEVRSTGRNLTGFEARAERGVSGRGRIILAEEIETRAATRLTDALMGNPDVSRPSAYREVMFRTAQGTSSLGAHESGLQDVPCFPALWLDGMKMRSGGQPSNYDPRLAREHWLRVHLDELVPPSMVRGIEMYPSALAVPPEFRDSDSQCGAILVWTKR